ncbi:MAG: selenide, water dikinase SelD, partial [Burkholderiaceae bacterium]|nr:selenide, water dikinase SelD [Burkholderiaceae bacterium]
ARGFATGASQRNWDGYGHEVRLGAGIDAHQRTLLTDPQTSGGLLVACAPEAVDDVLAVFRRDGFDAACEIGALAVGEPGIEVTA